MEVMPGYKQTDIGLIPEDWDVRSIERVFSLKHGFAFSSKYFSSTGPIVLTPGNFHLEGGLYFDDRNTKRYSGNYSLEMTFRRGDLLIVMTDLTPTCNLLGKPAFVDTDEAILHNQRIGKVLLKDKSVHLPFLYNLLLSRPYLDHIREQAFGSTVRHTSNKSIYSAQLAWPPPQEQRAIAKALDNTNALLGGLERLIVKKRDLKQAAMQQLLTGQTRLPGFYSEWEVKRLGEIIETDPENLSSETRPEYTFNYIALEDVDRGFLRSYSEQRFATAPSRARRKLRVGDVLVSTVRPNLQSHLLFDAEGSNWVCSTGFCVVRCHHNVTHPGYIFFQMFANGVSRQIDSLLAGSNYPAINSGDVRALEILLPDYDEQAAIAAVLSDMDAELAALEARRDKTRALKQAMMQELLTGRTRLV
jgi:type I restriction enzyme, S subunit